MIEIIYRITPEEKIEKRMVLSVVGYNDNDLGTLDYSSTHEGFLTLNSFRLRMEPSFFNFQWCIGNNIDNIGIYKYYNLYINNETIIEFGFIKRVFQINHRDDMFDRISDLNIINKIRDLMLKNNQLTIKFELYD